ncbi:PrsW family glutamic-type intramembrane protease [Microlunatus ginsengisoli]|uniref:Membrane proteinase PrsW, cleaves anti-sigma factor RsiW, M82 family n=1 Tax=Microlunatus ginsengisoli TaxID=363863 RepID=A0ABP6ZQW7_9ACTN
MTDPAGSGPPASPGRRSGLGGWVGAVLAGCGVALFALLRAAYLITGEIHLLPALVVVGTSTVPVGFAAWLWSRYPPMLAGRRVPSAGALVGAGLAGGALALALSGLGEYAAIGTGSSVSPLVVGTVEEVAKLIPAVALVLWYARITADAGLLRVGLLSGVAVGAGFAVLETLGYAYAAAHEQDASLATVDQLLLVRGIFSPATHLTWTALGAAAAAGLVLALQRRRGVVLAVAVLVGTVLAVIATHAVWDRSETVLAHVALAVVGLTALWLVDSRLGRSTTGSRRTG